MSCTTFPFSLFLFYLWLIRKSEMRFLKLYIVIPDFGHDS